MTGVFFAACSSPKVEYREYKHVISNYSKNQFLTRYEAKDSTSSLLFFTELYIESKIRIENNSIVVFDSIVNTDRVLGLAEVEKIDNRHDCIVYDLENKKSFKISTKKSSKYKFIYLSKDYDTKKYTITYSNSLRAFY